MLINSLANRISSKLKSKCRFWFLAVRHHSETMASFVGKQLDLLEIEHLTEIEESNVEISNFSLKVLQRKGICIPKLVINSLETGLYSRSIASFSLRTVQKKFPFNIFSPGDIVKVHHSEEQLPSNEECNGIVTKVSDVEISAAFDSLAFRDTLDNLNQHGNSIALIKVANKVTYERLKYAMKDLSRYSSGPAQHLIDVLFGDAVPLSGQPIDVSFHNEKLNDCQRKAVSFALSQRELAIIHGPPGTGKTTTIIEIISQLVKSGLKVLACAPSNVAVDNLLEKLSHLEVEIKAHGFENKCYKRRLKLARLGHPARILDPKLQQLSLDALIFHSGAAAIIRDVRNDLESLQGKIRRCFNAEQRKKLYQERRSLTGELRKREKKAIKDILSPADVVLATNVGAYPRGPLQNLRHDHFDVVVIDECGQSLEAACWIPLLRTRKCILAGDHMQLPPTIVSHEAAAEGLSLTLLERLIKLHGDQVVRMLTEQYRMHHVIMEWASKQMYTDRLQAHHTVKSHLLSDIDEVEETEDTTIPMLLIDTTGCDSNEAESEESDSKANEVEARIVYRYVSNLLQAGVRAEDIAVISPYNLQVDVLRHLFHEKEPKLEIKSVDGFQGREKEAVILSLVRSNPAREVGFLSDNRRLNVAVTRARRHLAVVCDLETVSRDDFIKSLLDYMNKHGEVRTGWEYINEEDDTEVVDCLRSFHLVAPTKTENKAANDDKKEKPKKSNNVSSQKTEGKRKKTASRRQTDDSSESDKKDELKETYREILVKFKNRFQLENSGQREPKKNGDLDLSQALDIKVYKSENKIVFPSTLTALERRVVHEVAEDMSLAHWSTGEGSSRFIAVSFRGGGPVELNAKKDTEVFNFEKSVEVTAESSTINFEATVSHTETINDETATHGWLGKVYVENTDENNTTNLDRDSTKSLAVNDLPCTSKASATYVTCEKCGKNLPADNLDIHLLHCERSLRMKKKMAEEKSTLNSKTANANTASKSRKKQKGRPSKQETKEDDFETLIGDAISSNRSCFHSNCSASVTTTGQFCNICKKTFCLSHSLPEVHGCGERARVNARRQISRDGILTAGSGRVNHKPPAEKRVVMKNKLESKIKDLEIARKSANKGKR